MMPVSASINNRWVHPDRPGEAGLSGPDQTSRTQNNNSACRHDRL